MIAPAEWTVIQYFPDPLADERVNIGVAVIAHGKLRYEFIRNFSRVRLFAKQAGIEPVIDFRDQVAALSASSIRPGQVELPYVGASATSAVEFLRHVSVAWNHQIQCMPFQPSMDEPNRLLVRLRERYLRLAESDSPRRETVSKATIASRAVQELRSALPTRSLAEFQVQMHRHASGHIIPKIVMDVSLVNGELKLAGQAASFQGTDLRELRHVWREALLTLDDLRRARSNLLVSFHVAPPRLGDGAMSHEYEEATNAARDASIEIVPLDNVSIWARRVADSPALAISA